MDAELNKHVVKTGTTTLGIVCKEGIVIAADKRATYGTSDGQGVSYIANRNVDKIIQVLPNVVTTIAGGASDALKVVKLIRAELKLKELKSRKQSSLKEVANLFANVSFQNIRQPSIIPAIAHFVLAGYDPKGEALYDVSPDGFLKEVEEYVASGSGMMQVNPILDSDYKKGMTLDEGIALAKKCLLASFGRDPASGEGMDIYTITKDEIKQVTKTKLVAEFKER
jgi:proteasome beta subunit